MRYHCPQQKCHFTSTIRGLCPKHKQVCLRLADLDELGALLPPRIARRADSLVRSPTPTQAVIDDCMRENYQQFSFQRQTKTDFHSIYKEQCPSTVLQSTLRSAAIKQSITNFLRQHVFVQRDYHKPMTILGSYAEYIHARQQVKAIRITDPRVALRGQKGLFAKAPQPINTIVGIYVGKIFWDTLENDTIIRDQYEEPPKYLFGYNSYGYELVIDGGLGSNWTSYLNANTTYAPGEQVSVANVKAHQILWHGFPLIIFITSKLVPAQHEFMLDYGAETYWDRV